MRRQGERGYSLVELVTVLIIVGILVGLSISQVGSKRNTAVKTATLQMASALKRAQTIARSRGVQVTVQTRGATQATQTLDALYPDILNGNAMVRECLYGNSMASPARGGNGQLDLVLLDYGNLQLPTVGVNWTTLNTQPQFRLLFGATMTPSSIVTNSYLFTGSQSNPLSFATNGMANGNYAVTFIGAKQGQAYANAPVGVVMVTQSGAVMAFFKADPSSPTKTWQRL